MTAFIYLVFFPNVQVISKKKFNLFLRVVTRGFQNMIVTENVTEYGVIAIVTCISEFLAIE